MINIGFWKRVKEKWIRREDPTVERIKPIIEEDGRETGEIDELYMKLNDINSTLEQLNSLSDTESPFGTLFSKEDE